MWWTTWIAHDECTAWTYEARRRLIFKCLLAIPVLIFALIVIEILPPIFFLFVLAWATYVRVPRFRAAVYASLLLGTVCLYSPFGWGFTHHPAPGLNYLLSLGFFGFLWMSGTRTVQAWWQTTGCLRPPTLLVGATLLVAVLNYGSSSLSLQATSAHYQRINHVTAILSSLGMLAGFGLLEYVRRIAKSGSYVDEKRRD